MAVFHWRFCSYLKTMFDAASGVRDTWLSDPLLGLFAPELAEGQATASMAPDARFLRARNAAAVAASDDVVSALAAGFEEGVVDCTVGRDSERRLVALKLGFTHLPATTAATIEQGFGSDIDREAVLRVFASHGLSRSMKGFAEVRDFAEINRRGAGLARVLAGPEGEQAHLLRKRFEAISAWLLASRSERGGIIERLPVSRTVFFKWWNAFRRLGLLGLAPFGSELLRRSKIGADREALIVVDRLQHPERADSFYVRRLAARGVRVKRNALAKVFSKWNLGSWSSRFVSNLNRLETAEWEQVESLPEPPEEAPPRLVEQLFFYVLRGAGDHALPFAAPGLPVLWAYLEELGIVPILASMGLTGPVGRERYSWLDLLLFDIGRRFLGIPSLSAACEGEGPEAVWFAHLYSPPCNDTLLSGMARISETQVAQLRAWLVERLAQLGLGSGKRIAFDFHHIDLDVILDRLRCFGKGPSPKKKLCWTGFRPHIAWDVENGTLLVAEFRKASARGTTTIRRFVGDYILPTFEGLFETVYIDSEYTGKDVWNFILDSTAGMGAQLTACLRQNSFVKAARDRFLSDNEGRTGFWKHYDDKHEVGAKTFPLRWTYVDADGQTREFKLNCVVKRNILNGKMRVFASSRDPVTPAEILADYSSRWVIENGIKDLIVSYFLDACPGTEPHHVDVHFLVTTICRTLYRMIERDLGENLTNPGGSVRTLDRMRNALFSQGAATLNREQDTLVVRFLNAYRAKRTNMLRNWFRTVTHRHPDGIALLGGLKLRFELLPPRGEEYRNTGRKIDLAEMKNLDGLPENV